MGWLTGRRILNPVLCVQMQVQVLPVIKKGIKFDSKLESNFDDFIIAQPQIKLIERQVKVELFFVLSL